MTELSLGIIGISDGNGHPFSWSAICNGYDENAMSACPYPVIYEYLSKQNFPEAAISNASVDYIWTQDEVVSKEIARASRITNVCQSIDEMIPHIDAVLLARDDAENHLSMALPFIKAGLPIYIDKPICLSIHDLDELYRHEQYPGQIFTCSALQYAAEFDFSHIRQSATEVIKQINCKIANSWNKYAIHMIEPSLKMANISGDDFSLNFNHVAQGISVCFQFQNVEVNIQTGLIGQVPTIEVETDLDRYTMIMRDYFAAFKTGLELFVDGVINQKQHSSPIFVKQCVKMIESVNEEFNKK